MNETLKTVIFVAVAVLVVAAVWATRPVIQSGDPSAAVGQSLFPDFKDPLTATSMEIVKYDEETGDRKTFKVAQADGIWSIPSHDDYPADAKDQLAEAAVSVLGLKILALVSEKLGDQEEYGVVDPSDKNIKPGTPGVGVRVTMRDKDNKTLLDLVVGKRDEEQAQNRFVRRVGQDQIYSVKVDTDKLSTKFADWIEPDLLQLNPWDIRQIDIQDYSVDEAQMSVIQRGEIWLDYDDAAEKDKWKLAADRKFAEGKWVAEQMTPGMELNAKKLDEMKSALDDLKIVDVARKPAELSAALKNNKEFLRSPEAVDSLAMRGFYLANVKGVPGIYSNEGEFRCLMKNGVEYVLRFGNISESRRADDAADKKEGKTDKDEDKSDEKQSAGMNRYIFVMAEFNPSAIAKPTLEELPELPKEEAAKPAADGAKEDKPADDAKEGKPADAEKPGEAEAADTDDKKPEPVAEKPAGDEKAKDAKPEEKKPSPEEIKAKREKVEKENKRKLDEYEEKVAEAKKKVEELNNRFADWYYVIPNSVYEKIHLGRNDIIVKKSEEKKDDASKDLPDVGGVPPAILNAPQTNPPAETEPTEPEGENK